MGAQKSEFPLIAMCWAIPTYTDFTTEWTKFHGHHTNPRTRFHSKHTQEKNSHLPLQSDL